MLVLDTNAVSRVMQRRPAALERLRREDAWAVVVCAPVAAEIHYGLARLVPGSRRRRLLEEEFRRLRAAVRWADWDEAAAAEFGRVKAELEAHGTPLEDFDVAIAACALARGARLATTNHRHLARIDGLHLDDWSDV